MNPEIAADHGGLDLKFLNFLPKPIREARNAPLSVVAAWATPSFRASRSHIWSLSFSRMRPIQSSTSRQPCCSLRVVVFAPVLETLIMGTALLVLLRLVSPVAAILISAIGWGVAHSLAGPSVGVDHLVAVPRSFDACS